MRSCRAVIFDLDDTLVATSQIDRRAILDAASLATADCDAEEVANRFAALLKAEPFPPSDSELDVPTWRTQLWSRSLNDGEQAKLAHDTWSEQRLANFRFEDEVVAMVKRLQASGRKIGVLTNGHRDVQRGKTRACGAEDLFGDTYVIVAGEHPEQKPSPAIFRVACAALGEEPANTVMVGDSYAADITGGINAGLLATVWVRPLEDETAGSASLMHGHVTAVPPGQPEPSHVVSSVLELEKVLDEIG